MASRAERPAEIWPVGIVNLAPEFRLLHHHFDPACRLGRNRSISGLLALAPAFADASAGLKDYLAANPGTSLAVSGYNDPSGNAAANAELSKNRAQAVAAALVTSGIAEASVALVKPEQTTDTAVSTEAARRVEVVVK